jgi:hypothetical protein
VEGVKFYENVLLILSVPAEYSKKELAIMRECAFKADLIKKETSEYLQFTTERMYFDYKIIIAFKNNLLI